MHNSHGSGSRRKRTIKMGARLGKHYKRWNEQEVFPHSRAETEVKHQAHSKPNSFYHRSWKNQGVSTSLWHP